MCPLSGGIGPPGPGQPCCACACHWAMEVCLGGKSASANSALAHSHQVLHLAYEYIFVRVQCDVLHS